MQVLLECSVTVEPASAVPFTLGVVEVDGEAGVVAMTIGVAVCGAEPGLRPTSSTVMLLTPSPPFV